MLRLALTLCVALVSWVALVGNGHAQDRWVPITTIEIDPSVAGDKTEQLEAVAAAAGAWRGVRLKPTQTLTLSRVVVTPLTGAQVVKTTSATAPLVAGPTKPLEITWSAAQPVKILGLAWPAQDVIGKVKVTIEGLASTQTAGAGATDGGRPRTGATRGGEATGGSGPPPTRGIGAPPPPPSPAPSASVPKSADGDRGTLESARPPAPTRGIGAPPPSQPTFSGTRPTCVDDGKCTLVNVFFGTDRNKVDTPTRIKFGTERAERLTLGHGFVTVPRVRDRGTLPTPTTIDALFRRLPPEGDPVRHFTIPKNGVKVYASEADFLAEVKGHMANAGAFKEHAFIYIHGFAVGFDDALYRAAQISYDLSTDGNPFGTAFVYSWPSKGSILPSAYLTDQDSSDFAVPHLKAFIELVSEKTGAKNVHLIAHSMGNRVLMATIKEMALTGSTARLNQIILAAPDVDKRQFENIAQNIGKIAKGATLYASNADRAIGLSRDIRNAARAGDTTEPPGPAIVPGIVDTIDISGLKSAATSVFGLLETGHDRYADNQVILADIAKLFTTGVRPPEKRNAQFERLLKGGTLAYWRYK
jgi:esterase/lipase superfamily enzyme